MKTFQYTLTILLAVYKAGVYLFASGSFSLSRYRRIGTFIGKRHGNGTGQIVLDEVNCEGTEQSIDECRHSPWGTHDCTHNEDVSISCGRLSS